MNRKKKERVKFHKLESLEGNRKKERAGFCPVATIVLKFYQCCLFCFHKRSSLGKSGKTSLTHAIHAGKLADWLQLFHVFAGGVENAVDWFNFSMKHKREI